MTLVVIFRKLRNCCSITPTHTQAHTGPSTCVCMMAKRRNPQPEGYPGLRSKRQKLAPLLPHERDYLSLPTTDSLPLPVPPPPPSTNQHHHRYDLRVRPPRPPNPVVNGERRGNGENSLQDTGRWRNAHSFSLNYQQQQQHQRVSATSSQTRRRRQPSPQRKRRRKAPPNENDLVRDPHSVCIIEGVFGLRMRRRYRVRVAAAAVCSN